MKVQKLSVVSYKTVAAFFAAVFALGATSCKDDSWSQTYGPGTEIITTDMNGWEQVWEENFNYESMPDLWNAWDLVDMNTKEEWSTYGYPASKEQYINPEIGDNFALINDKKNVVLTAFAQDLYSKVEEKISTTTGLPYLEYTYIKYGDADAVAVSSTGKAVDIIAKKDEIYPNIPGLGGVIYSHAKVGETVNVDGENLLVKPIRIEFRAKMTAGKNACPMIYLVPANPRNAVDLSKGRDEIAKTRNSNGFIRVMEHYNSDAYVTQYLNSNYITNWGQVTPVSKVKAPANYQDFNNYMVEITNTGISFYVNNVRTLYYPKFDTATQEPVSDRYPFAQEYNIILGVGMGNPPVEAAQTFNFGTVSMEVDYIKYYTKAE